MIKETTRRKKRKFTWDSWNYDCDGAAYIIAKDQCPERKAVPDFICGVDDIHPDCKSDMVVQEGWCRWEVRSDWENTDGGPMGWYVVYGEKVPRSFPVWIVRKGFWY